MAVESLLSRRGVMLGLVGTAGAGTVAVQQSGGVQAFRELLRPMEKGTEGAWLASASAGDWALEVGALFTVSTGHVLKLLDVQNYPRKGVRPRGVRTGGFVARFDVVKGDGLPGNAIYRVNHAAGEFDVFLTAHPSRHRRMFAEFN